MTDEVEVHQEAIADDAITAEPPEVPETSSSPFDDPIVPVPTEITAELYRDFGENFGDVNAVRLQSAWQDQALPNSAIAQALLDDNPDLRSAINGHENEHGIGIEGVQAASAYLAKQSGFDSSEALFAANRELDALLQENFDEATKTLSMSGAYQALAHIARKAGYRYTYRGN